MKNGEDLNCGDTFQEYCMDTIGQGLMNEADLDTALVRVLEARFSVGEFDNPANVRWTSIPDDVLDCQEHRDLAYKAAQEAIVLLKNDNGFLPLDRNKSVAIIGPLGNTVNLGYIYSGDWVAFNDVDFGNGRSRLDVLSGGENDNATVMEVFLDAIDYTPEATITLPVTGDRAKYVTTTTDIDPAVFSGVHKVFTRFSGGDKYCNNMDWMKFYNPDNTDPLQADGPLYYEKGYVTPRLSARSSAKAGLLRYGT